MAEKKDMCWPTTLQEALLRATILDGDGARDAWAEWTSKADFDNLDQGSNRLMPETYTNLVAHGIDHPLLGRMKGMKRRTWLENQLLFHQATAAIRILDEIGIQTMVTKGPALVLKHYRDHGRRPMADFDIVVRREHAWDAVESLRENGFTLMESEWEQEAAEGAEDIEDIPGGGLLHAVTCVNDMGRQFDLHWQVISGCSLEGPFWEEAGPVSINETTTLAPASSDLLLHVCVHGLRPNPVPPLRWIVDAKVILDDVHAVDWDRLVAMARELKFAYRMRQALGYLKRLGLGIPDDVLERLSGVGAFGFQQLEFERITRKRKKSLRTQVATVWLGFTRYAGSSGGIARFGRLPSYLKDTWRVGNTWRLPGVALRKAARRLRR